MSVKRRDLIRYLELNGFAFVREGGRHSMYSNGAITIPIKRHRTFHNQIANKICKQAGLEPRF